MNVPVKESAKKKVMVVVYVTMTVRDANINIVVSTLRARTAGIVIGNEGSRTKNDEH
jgi:hypothetical protein